MDKPASVLVINVSRIGDTLFATPALRAIAAAWPQAAITVLGHPNRAEVFKHLPFIAECGSISKRSAPWRGWLGGRYDYAFVYGFDQALVRYALRVARRVVAFRQSDSRINERLYRVVDLPPFQSEHAVLQALRLPAAVGIEPAGLRLAFALSDDEKSWARQRLETEGMGGRKPLVGLQVASFPTKGYRDWPVESFAQLCDAISQARPDTGFLIFGGSEEKQRTVWLKEKLGAKAALLAGKLSLRQTAAMMALCDAYVGVDTGPTHIMSCFDVPIVGLYHCLSSSALTGPLDHPLNFCLDHPRTGRDCDDTTPMAEISVETVLARVGEALASRKLIEPGA